MADRVPYNVYCDESCHLESDSHSVMVLGAIWCPAAKAMAIAKQVRAIKAFHGLSPNFEIKWTKVSPAKVNFYLELLNYFFSEDDLHFRALIVRDKSNLRHDSFNQSHDGFYFKMYFDMLKVLLSPDATYRIYLDIKDSCGAEKVRLLHNVLAHSVYDFGKEVVSKLQLIRSHEVEQLQLADLLIGCISYVNRDLSGSPAKVQLVDRLRKLTKYQLTRSTLLREQKVNIFAWTPQKDRSE